MNRKWAKHTKHNKQMPKINHNAGYKTVCENKNKRNMIANTLAYKNGLWAKYKHQDSNAKQQRKKNAKIKYTLKKSNKIIVQIKITKNTF